MVPGITAWGCPPGVTAIPKVGQWRRQASPVEKTAKGYSESAGNYGPGLGIEPEWTSVAQAI